MDHSEESVIEFCAGAGMLSEGVRRACGDLRVRAFVEIEAFAIANLAAKAEADEMDAAPVWTNVKTFPGREFHGKIRGVLAGYPCQPFSCAGKRRGAEDPRHLWPFIARAIDDIQPAWVFVENVGGHVKLGLREVLADLVGLGYRVEGRGGQPTWGLFAAIETGAPQVRQRVFILAHRDGARPQGHAWDGDREERWNAKGRPTGPGSLSRGGETDLAHRGIFPRGAERGRGGAEGEMLLHPRWAEAPAGAGECGPDGIWPAWRGEPQHPWEPPRILEPSMGGDADGLAGGLGEPAHGARVCSRVDEIRLLGNGVVPHQAELAWRTLWSRV